MAFIRAAGKHATIQERKPPDSLASALPYLEQNDSDEPPLLPAAPPTAVPPTAAVAAASAPGGTAPAAAALLEVEASPAIAVVSVQAEGAAEGQRTVVVVPSAAALAMAIKPMSISNKLGNEMLFDWGGDMPRDMPSAYATPPPAAAPEPPVSTPVTPPALPLPPGPWRVMLVVARYKENVDWLKVCWVSHPIPSHPIPSRPRPLGHLFPV